MAAVLCLCFKYPCCLLGHNMDMYVINEKSKLVCFIYMQPQTLKFKSVQINMKHVSYTIIHKY